VSVVVGITAPNDGSSSSAGFTSKLNTMSASALSTTLKAALPTLASSLTASSVTVAAGQITSTPTPAPSPYSLPTETSTTSAANMGIVGATVGGFITLTIIIFKCYSDPYVPPEEESDWSVK
jgi:hypothetical protein